MYGAMPIIPLTVWSLLLLTTKRGASDVFQSSSRPQHLALLSLSLSIPLSFSNPDHLFAAVPIFSSNLTSLHIGILTNVTLTWNWNCDPRLLSFTELGLIGKVSNIRQWRLGARLGISGTDHPSLAAVNSIWVQADDTASPSSHVLTPPKYRDSQPWHPYSRATAHTANWQPCNPSWWSYRAFAAR